DRRVGAAAGIAVDPPGDRELSHATQPRRVPPRHAAHPHRAAPGLSAAVHARALVGVAGHRRPAVERVQQVPAGAGRAQRQRRGGAEPAAMILVRSLVFQLLFYGWTIILAIVCLSALLLP